jgi:hypothetical protein
MLQWPSEPPRQVSHPYRDTLIVYGALALLIVLIGAVTGGNMLNAIVIAAAFYVAASAWSLVAWRRRLRRQAEGER